MPENSLSGSAHSQKIEIREDGSKHKRNRFFKTITAKGIPSKLQASKTIRESSPYKGTSPKILGQTSQSKTPLEDGLSRPVGHYQGSHIFLFKMSLTLPVF